MATSHTPPAALPDPIVPRLTQPGGHGLFVRAEIAWGRWRRWFLRRFRPHHVAAWQSVRKGDPGPHDIIDSRDLKFVRPGCSIEFPAEIDRFARREHWGFARFGWAELLGFSALLLPCVALGIVLALTHSAWWALAALVPLLLWIEVVWFFRDPPRNVPNQPGICVSPADGRVTDIEMIDDPTFPAGRALRISIFLSIFSVHVNRMPRSGRVTRIAYFPGEYLDARNVESARRNEQLWIDALDERTGRPLRVKQISGAIARRIVCPLRVGDRLTIGQRIGMIKFGSRTDLLLDPELVGSVEVKVGDMVHGASTVLVRCQDETAIPAS